MITFIVSKKRIVFDCRLRWVWLQRLPVQRRIKLLCIIQFPWRWGPNIEYSMLDSCDVRLVACSANGWQWHVGLIEDIQRLWLVAYVCSWLVTYRKIRKGGIEVHGLTSMLKRINDFDATSPLLFFVKHYLGPAPGNGLRSDRNL